MSENWLYKKMHDMIKSDDLEVKKAGLSLRKHFKKALNNRVVVQVNQEGKVKFYKIEDADKEGYKVRLIEWHNPPDGSNNKSINKPSMK